MSKGVSTVPFVDLTRQYKNLRGSIKEAFDTVGLSGSYVLGDKVQEFEVEFARYCDTKYAIAVGNGTDALFLTLKALGIGEGDEVITAPNSFIATTGAIVASGAKPVFVDIKKNLNIDPEKIHKVVTSRSSALLPVHLTGRPAPMNAINSIAEEYDLHVIEDAAQAIGAKYYGKRVGSLGDAGCFSLHPLKNLHVYGDGGIITTNSKELTDKLRQARNHGLINRDECKLWGQNSRLDDIQASIGLVKLKYLDGWTQRMREIARIYTDELKNVVVTPDECSFEESVYHNYIILADERDNLQKYLLSNGIETKIHYPIPIYLQESAEGLGYKQGDFPVTEMMISKILSLPIYSEFTNQELDKVIRTIILFYK